MPLQSFVPQLHKPINAQVLRRQSFARPASKAVAAVQHPEASKTQDQTRAPYKSQSQASIRATLAKADALAAVQTNHEATETPLCSPPWHRRLTMAPTAPSLTRLYKGRMVPSALASRVTVAGSRTPILSSPESSSSSSSPMPSASPSEPASPRTRPAPLLSTPNVDVGCRAAVQPPPATRPWDGSDEAMRAAVTLDIQAGGASHVAPLKGAKPMGSAGQQLAATPPFTSQKNGAR